MDQGLAPTQWPWEPWGPWEPWEKGASTRAHTMASLLPATFLTTSRTPLHAFYHGGHCHLLLLPPAPLNTSSSSATSTTTATTSSGSRRATSTAAASAAPAHSANAQPAGSQWAAAGGGLVRLPTWTGLRRLAARDWTPAPVPALLPSIQHQLLLVRHSPRRAPIGQAQIEGCGTNERAGWRVEEYIARQATLPRI